MILNSETFHNKQVFV